MEYHTAVKKKKLLYFATAWMDLETVMLSELSQSVKDKYHMISHVESNEHNKLMNKIETEHKYMKQTASCQRRGGRNWMKDDEAINQSIFMHNPWTGITMWKLTWGERGWCWMKMRKGRKSKNKHKNINNKN